MRGPHDVQRVAQQWRAARRRGRGAGYRGFGHLGVQYAAKMGFKAVGIARGKDKDRSAGNWGLTLH